MSDGFAPVAGGRLFYDEAGDGVPVVFVPGFTMDTRMWEAQVGPFSAAHRTIRYDPRGAGRSDPPSGPYAQHDDLAALLDHLAIEKAHVVALSLGGAIAVDFALTCPERVRSLTLVDTSALGGYPYPDQLADAFAAITGAAKAGDMARARALWLAMEWFGPAREKPDVAAALERIVADYSGWHFANPNPVERLTPRAVTRLEEISAPTLVVVGERDLAFYNIPIAEELARRIPGARMLTMASVGHMANMEDPASFNAAVLRFLAEVDGPPQ